MLLWEYCSLVAGAKKWSHNAAICTVATLPVLLPAEVPVLLPEVHGVPLGASADGAAILLSCCCQQSCLCGCLQCMAQPVRAPVCCLQFMAHLWEPLRVVHKPLAVHLVSEVWGLVTHGILLWMGFSHGSHKVRWPAWCP